ncbi:MAG: hypothetical protein HQL30_00015 [Candidatus Omnitrophica bacterium]|nr:hypothetical protein [Candidatus Omnitrophota bacterium]
MRKVNFILFFLLAVALSRSADAQLNQTTQGAYNGVWVENKLNSSSGHIEISSYVCGVIDCAIKMDPDLMARYYSNSTKEKITGAVISYYKEYPFKKYKPIIDVILSGFQ